MEQSGAAIRTVHVPAQRALWNTHSHSEIRRSRGQFLTSPRTGCPGSLRRVCTDSLLFRSPRLSHTPRCFIPVAFSKLSKCLSLVTLLLTQQLLFLPQLSHSFCAFPRVLSSAFLMSFLFSSGSLKSLWCSFSSHHGEVGSSSQVTCCLLLLAELQNKLCVCLCLW